MKKYALMYWNIKNQKMMNWTPRNFMYLTQKQFDDDDWAEKGFQLNLNDEFEISKRKEKITKICSKLGIK